MRRGSMAARGSAVLGLAAAVGLAGCFDRGTPTSGRAGRGPSAPHEAPAAAPEALRRETDQRACQGAVQQLNTHLARQPDPRLEQVLAERRPAAEQLATLLQLDDEERAEALGPSFTLLDSHHLDLCFLVRDAMRG